MQETQLQQKEILAEKKENISKKSMHKKIRLISFISILGILEVNTVFATAPILSSFPSKTLEN